MDPMLSWVQQQLPGKAIPRGFGREWKDGTLACALMENLVPGSCSQTSYRSFENWSNVIKALEHRLGVKCLVTAEELCQGFESKVICLLAQIRAASEAPILDNKEDDEIECFARGMGLILAVRGRVARFNVYLNPNIYLNLIIEIRGPKNSLCTERLSGRSPKKKVLQSNTIPLANIEETHRGQIPFEYEMFMGKIHFGYIPLSLGQHLVSIIWQGEHVLGSPFRVTVADSVEAPLELRSESFKAPYPIHRSLSEPNKLTNSLRTRGKLGSVTRKRILRHVMTVDGKETVVDVKDSEMLAGALKSLANKENEEIYEINDKPTKTFSKKEYTPKNILKIPDIIIADESNVAISDVDDNITPPYDIGVNKLEQSNNFSNIKDLEIKNVDDDSNEGTINSNTSEETNVIENKVDLNEDTNDESEIKKILNESEDLPIELRKGDNKEYYFLSQEILDEDNIENTTDDSNLYNDKSFMHLDSHSNIENKLDKENRNNLPKTNQSNNFQLKQSISQDTTDKDNSIFKEGVKLQRENSRINCEIATSKIIEFEVERKCLSQAFNFEEITEVLNSPNYQLNLKDAKYSSYQDLHSENTNKYVQEAKKFLLQKAKSFDQLELGASLPVSAKVDLSSEKVSFDSDSQRNQSVNISEQPQNENESVFETEMYPDAKASQEDDGYSSPGKVSVKDRIKKWESLLNSKNNSNQEEEPPSVSDISIYNYSDAFSPSQNEGSPVILPLKNQIEKAIQVTHRDILVNAEIKTIPLHWSNYNSAVSSEPGGTLSSIEDLGTEDLNTTQKQFLTTRYRANPIFGGSEMGETIATEDQRAYIDDDIPDYANLLLTDYVSYTGLLNTDTLVEHSQLSEEDYLNSDDHEPPIPYPGRCRVLGNGVRFGQVGVRNRFKVKTKGAGRGSLTVNIQGTGKHDVIETIVSYAGNDHYEVMYDVTEPGYYVITVKWCEWNVPDSPFICKVTY